MKNIVIASDSFKGSCTSMEVADYLAQGIQTAKSDVKITKIALADGGEGTVQAIIKATDGKLITSKVSGPTGRQIDAQWGLIDAQTAVIEMAAAAGFTQGKTEDAAIKSTFGVGELIVAALDHGVSKIYLGLGGSSTNDGGVGMAQALGAHFLDAQSHEIGPGISGLADLAKVDFSQIDPRIREVNVVGLSDVDNQLTGPTGATAVFGPQKGILPGQIAEDDQRLAHLAKLTTAAVGRDFSINPGSGAAGGLGFGVLAFLGGRLMSGIEVIMQLTHLKAIMSDAALVITGEGRIDQQTLNGKLPLGVAKLAKQAAVPVVAVAGSLSGDLRAVYQQGFDLLISTTTSPMSLQDAIDQGPNLIRAAGYRIGKILQLKTRFEDK